MHRFSDDELSSLVRADRVNRKIYVDPDLFELELERIFYFGWIFVAHESQLPRPGDFFCTRVGRQPILVTRHADGRVYAHYNRCAHRGAVVVNAETGSSDRYQCMYHGWTYGTDGRLLFSPRQAVEEEAGKDFSKVGLTPVEQCNSYRGFIFVKLK